MKNEEQSSKAIVYLVASGKGGSGKSIFTYVFSEKFKTAFVLDSDDASKSTMQHLAYRNPVRISFLDSAGRIDRNAFNNMFESVAKAGKGIFISDTGASVSDQLPLYFQSNGPDLVFELLEANNIKLKIICVVCGKNDFRTCMEYLVNLVDSTKGFIEIIAAHNKHFEMSEDQLIQFESFCKDQSIRNFSYDLLADRSQISLTMASDVLKAGKGLSGLDPFRAIYFKKALLELPNDL